MQIGICGAGRFGQYLVDKFTESDKWKVVCYIDNATNLSRNRPVISYNELGCGWQKKIDAVIVALSNYYTIGDIIMQLHNEELKIPVLIAKPELWKKRLDISVEQLFDEYIYPVDIQNKAVITKLEYHVCDVCNLNCKGCSHFAPIFKSGFSSIDEFSNNLKQLAKLFSNILRLRLMGGEPFLHKELSLFIKTARECFPNAHLEIVTNGLLLETIEEKVWSSIREHNALLQISLYPPTYAIKDRLESLLDKKEIEYSFGSGLEQYNDEGIIKEFHKNLTECRNHNPEEAVRYCMGSRCHYLRNGKISKCALPLLAPEINKYFKTNYTVEQGDVIDIYDKTLSAWDMIERLYCATPFCSYCIMEKPHRFTWSAQERKIELSDYIVQE